MFYFLKRSQFVMSFVFVSFSLCLINISNSKAQVLKLPADTAIVSTHEITIEGHKVHYKATVGTLPVYGTDGKPDAALFYTYYKRTDVKKDENRPILFSFNGGPDAGSLWAHLGYTSPKKVKLSDKGFPVQPYGVVDNHHSILDVTDIVYVNPVNTGFSRMLNDGKREQFFGVKEDITYLADWIDRFIAKKGRWGSPKFLMGESYGTTRVAGLAGELTQKRKNIQHWVYLNGVILVSGGGGAGRDRPLPRAVESLPYFTATAWYHHKLPKELQNKDLNQILPKVEKYAINKYLPALAKGDRLNETHKQEIAEQIARYSGLDKDFILDYNLTVPSRAFQKELLRNEGYTLGRLDARYKGIDRTDGGSSFDFTPDYTSWEHSFTPAINHYLRKDLGFKTNLRYYVEGPVHPWNRERVNTGSMLRQAMMQNPNMQLLFQVGYYDSSWFGSKVASWNLDPSGKLQDRIHEKEYRSGHMLYVRAKDRAKGTNDIRKFIKNAIPKRGEPIKY